MDIKSKIAAKQAELEAAQIALTESDRAEIQDRAELAKLQAQIDAERETAKALDLDRRLDKAKDTIGPKGRVKAISIVGFDDTFIIEASAAAHQRWVEAVSEAATGRKGVDRAKASRDYALAVVYDWNGTITGMSPELTAKLDRYLVENPGLVTPITDAAIELAGVLAAERKS